MQKTGMDNGQSKDANKLSGPLLHPGLSSDSLLAIATLRRNTLAELDQLLTAAAEQIVSLIPPELAAFASESHLADVDCIKRMIETIGAKDEHPPYRVMSDKLKDPETYGFANYKEARAGMLKLKKAWAGIIDVRLGAERNYVEVYVSPVKPAM